MLVPTLKCTCTPWVVTSSLETFTEPSLIWNSDVWFLVDVSSRLVLFATVLSGVWVSDSHLDPIEAHAGYLQVDKALYR